MRSAEIIKSRIGNKKIAVLGLGVSNIPLVELLLECGNDITVHDKREISLLGDDAKKFEALGVNFQTGESYLDKIDADVIFRSPGIRSDLGGIPEAVKRGAILTSEMEMFFELAPAKIIGITGSDGKTTTTTITYKLLEKEFENTKRRVFVGGNIGTPLLSLVGDMTENDIAVIELSSFQLFTMKKSPWRAVLTNVSPNHLDWHTDMDEYTATKSNIYKNGASHLTTNAKNDICRKLCEDIGIDITLFSSVSSCDDIMKISPSVNNVVYLKNGIICYFDGKNETEMLDTKDIVIPGIHNIENYMAAISACWGLVSPETVRAIASTFGGVKHRLEFVRELDGVKYYNSSIDSSPTRTAAALSALSCRPIVICGGRDKNTPFEPLARALYERARAVVLTGEAAEKIYDVLQNEGGEGKDLIIRIEKDFDSAVMFAKALANEGDTVLLSPACTSFDAFKNFEERGERFKKIVKGF